MRLTEIKSSSFFFSFPDTTSISRDDRGKIDKCLVFASIIGDFVEFCKNTTEKMEVLCTDFMDFFFRGSTENFSEKMI
jgi:hypothetical protein